MSSIGNELKEYLFTVTSTKLFESSINCQTWVTPLGEWQGWPLACLGLDHLPIILGCPTSALFFQLPPRSGVEPHCLVSFHWLWCYKEHSLVPCTAAQMQDATNVVFVVIVHSWVDRAEPKQKAVFWPDQQGSDTHWWLAALGHEGKKILDPGNWNEFQHPGTEVVQLEEVGQRSERKVWAYCICKTATLLRGNTLKERSMKIFQGFNNHDDSWHTDIAFKKFHFFCPFKSCFGSRTKFVSEFLL